MTAVYPAQVLRSPKCQRQRSRLPAPPLGDVQVSGFRQQKVSTLPSPSRAPTLHIPFYHWHLAGLGDGLVPQQQRKEAGFWSRRSDRLLRMVQC